MRLGLLINDVSTEKGGYTTIRLGMAAQAMGHEVWFLDVADLALDPDDHVRGRARSVKNRKYKNGKVFLADLCSSRARLERITVDDLDVLLLRNDPSEDVVNRPWAVQAGIMFGRAAIRRGAIVLNDPNGLSKAMNKMYFQLFPEEVRPRTLITRSNQEIRAFASEVGSVVLKPLQGSGGQNVFLARPEDLANLNQMVDAVSRDGFVIVQEYLPMAVEGDVRMFLLNGLPMRHKGKYAAFRRMRRGDDLRSNVSAGGDVAPAVVDDRMLHLCEVVRPKLVADGMFLVGLDIVGDKLMEINVFSPGGLGNAQKFEGPNFSTCVIQALERKVHYMTAYQRKFENVQLATL